MPVLTSGINPRSEVFRANAEAMRGHLADLHKLIARIELGGGEKARERDDSDAGAAEQGRVLGIFRSLGSLSRAITPVLAGIVFWVFSSTSVFVVGAVLCVVALGLGTTLPKPEK